MIKVRDGKDHRPWAASGRYSLGWSLQYTSTVSQEGLLNLGGRWPEEHCSTIISSWDSLLPFPFWCVAAGTAVTFLTFPLCFSYPAQPPTCTPTSIRASQWDLPPPLFLRCLKLHWFSLSQLLLSNIEKDKRNLVSFWNWGNLTFAAIKNKSCVIYDFNEILCWFQLAENERNIKKLWNLDHPSSLTNLSTVLVLFIPSSCSPNHMGDIFLFGDNPKAKAIISITCHSHRMRSEAGCYKSHQLGKQMWLAGCSSRMCGLSS